MYSEYEASPSSSRMAFSSARQASTRRSARPPAKRPSARSSASSRSACASSRRSTRSRSSSGLRTACSASTSASWAASRRARASARSPLRGSRSRRLLRAEVVLQLRQLGRQVQSIRHGGDIVEGTDAARARRPPGRRQPGRRRRASAPPPRSRLRRAPTGRPAVRRRGLGPRARSASRSAADGGLRRVQLLRRGPDRRTSVGIARAPCRVEASGDLGAMGGRGLTGRERRRGRSLDLDRRRRALLHREDDAGQLLRQATDLRARVRVLDGELLADGPITSGSSARSAASRARSTAVVAATRADWAMASRSLAASQRASRSASACSAAVRSGVGGAWWRVGRSSAVTTGATSAASMSSMASSAGPRSNSTPCASSSPRGPHGATGRQPRHRVREQLPTGGVQPGHDGDVGVEVDHLPGAGGQLQQSHPRSGDLDPLDVAVVVVDRPGPTTSRQAEAGRRGLGDRGEGRRRCPARDLGSSTSSSAASSRLRVAWMTSRAAACRCSIPSWTLSSWSAIVRTPLEDHHKSALLEARVRDCHVTARSRAG